MQPIKRPRRITPAGASVCPLPPPYCTQFPSLHILWNDKQAVELDAQHVGNGFQCLYRGIGSPMLDAAQMRDAEIGIQRKRLIDWLRVNRYIYGVSNTPYQNRIEQGLLVLRNPEGKTHSDGTPVFALYAHVTPKGAGSIYRRLLDEGIIKRNDQLELSFS